LLTIRPGASRAGANRMPDVLHGFPKPAEPSPPIHKREAIIQAATPNGVPVVIAQRLRVPGGWLYEFGRGGAFVPDPAPLLCQGCQQRLVQSHGTFDLGGPFTIPEATAPLHDGSGQHGGSLDAGGSDLGRFVSHGESSCADGATTLAQPAPPVESGEAQ